MTEEIECTNSSYERILKRKKEILDKLPEDVRESIIQEELNKRKKEEEFLKKESERELTEKESEMLDRQMMLMKESIEYEKKMKSLKPEEKDEFAEILW